MTKHTHYYAEAERIAMRSGTGTGTTGLVWILGDHLGSTAITVDAATGAKLSELRFKPWGEVRYEWGVTGTKYRFQGQRSTEFDLYDFNARFYDARLGRFVQPDSVVPLASQGVQAWDRYAGLNNNPVRFNDPTGHMVDDGCRTEGCATDEESRNTTRNPVIKRIIEKRNGQYTRNRTPTSSPIPTPWGLTPTSASTPTPWVLRPTPSSTVTPQLTSTSTPSLTPTSTPSPTFPPMPTSSSRGVCVDAFNMSCNQVVDSFVNDFIIDGWSLIPPAPDSGPGAMPPDLPQTPLDPYLRVAASVIDLAIRVSHAIEWYSGITPRTPEPTRWPMKW